MAEPGDVLYVGYVLEKKYKVGRLLGRGGFGATYLAQDLNLRVSVAIKEFLPRQLVARSPTGTRVYPYSGSEHAFRVGLDQFLSEARNLAKFRGHPGIISVLDFFPENGTGYMVMEYLDGNTLEQYIANVRRLDVQVALRLVVPVADALRACHAIGLIHRDVSPDNIFLTSDGQVKVLDFGAARFATGAQSTNLSVILKAGYAPFEQYQQNGRQGPWTDIYALTATLYRLVTGSLPVPAVDRVAAVPLPPASRKGVGVSAEFQALLDKGLALRSEQRYQTVDAFLADVQTVLAGYDHLPSPPPLAFAEQSGEPEAGEMLGQIGQYELRSVLARTARSVVYDGWGPSIGRRVAVKAILLPGPQDGDADEERARLKRGIRAVRKLDHPNIVGIYDYIETQDRVYIVMEFVDGPTLHRILNSPKRFDPESIHLIIDGVLQGLHYGHSRGVMHGDINPSNILITGDRVAKIKFASARHDVGDGRQIGVMTGSPAYMSPEQFMGDKIDLRSDIYSTGVILYYMTTGVSPFEGSLGTITNKVLKSPVPRPSAISPMASAVLDLVVMRAMAKKPEQRFSSAAQFSAALSAALTRPGPVRRPVLPWHPPWRALVDAVRRSPIVVAGVIGVVVAAGAGTFWLWPSTPEPANLAVVGPTHGSAVTAETGRIDFPPNATTSAPDQARDAAGGDNKSNALDLASPAPEGPVQQSYKDAAPLPVPPPIPEVEHPRASLQNPSVTQALPPSIARKPGGPVTGIGGGENKKGQSAFAAPESPDLKELMNRIRNENKSLAPRPEPDGPMAPANPVQTPPAYATVYTSAIGLTCQTVTANTAQQLKLDAPRGLWCTGVAVGLAAFAAGIRTDDVLLTVNGSELHDLGALKTIAAGVTPGKKVPVEILRAGHPLTVYVALDQLRS